MKFVKNAAMLPMIMSTSTEEANRSNDSQYVQPIKKLCQTTTLSNEPVRREDMLFDENPMFIATGK